MTVYLLTRMCTYIITIILDTMTSEIQVKELFNEKVFQQNYGNKIAHYNHQGRQYLVSFAEKINRFVNTKCLFLYCKINNGDAFIGYTKVVKSRKHPLVDSSTQIKNKIKIKNVIGYFTIDQTKLSIKSENEAENIVFQFPNKETFNNWLNYLIEVTSKSLQQNITSTQIKENQYYKVEVEKYTQKLKQLEQRCKVYQARKEEVQGQKARLEKEMAEKEEKIERLENQMSSTQWNIKMAQNNNAIKDGQLQKLRQKIATLEKEQNQKEQKNIALLFQLETAKQNGLSEALKFQEREQSYRKMIEQQMSTIKNRQNEISNLKALLQTAENQMKELISAISNFWSGLNAIISTNRYEQVEPRIQQEIQYSKEELIEFITSSLAIISKLKERKDQLEIFSLFSGNSLDNYPNQKAYLKKTIQKFHNRKIIGTRLLYKFDTANKINFHHYIDNQPNIVLIVKTGQGAFVAGYSESPFNPNTAAEKSGLLMSLTEEKHFYLQEGKRVITYDDYYIIFGNSEIRLKSLESKIFSNFGIANGYYESRGMGVQALLGQNKREIDLETYEVHKVFIG